jgi:starch synthase
MNVMTSLFKEKKKILFVAPEAAPFVKAGGLGEVIFALPRALEDLGYDVRVMIPLYAGINQDKFKLKLIHRNLEVPTGSENTEPNEPANLICNVKKYIPNNDHNNHPPVITYFLENEEYYEKRSNVYGYNDDVVRWNLLCRGVLEFFRLTDEWTPDVIISNDWQTGFLPNLLKTIYKDDSRLAKIATIFVIHNLYYQGMFDHRYVADMDYDDGQSPIPSFFDPRIYKINGMRRGIMYSDKINTVSPTYSREIMTKDYGELLEELLKEKRAHVSGVLNGIDYDSFNPETDPNLINNYHYKSIEKRENNKLELQARFNLPQNKDIPLLCIASRFVEQKGFDLFFNFLEPVLREEKIQLVVLGSGDAKYMGYFTELAEKLPKQVGIHLNFDTTLPRLIFGGADIILIPSKFEPCGLSQIEAMRYGVIPIVRKTGGLADSVIDVDPATGKGTGFTFDNFDSLSLALTIARALEDFKNKKLWLKIQKQAMTQDFSWTKSAVEYSKIINKAITYHKNNKK